MRFDETGTVYVISSRTVAECPLNHHAQMQVCAPLTLFPEIPWVSMLLWAPVSQPLELRETTLDEVKLAGHVI